MPFPAIAIALVATEITADDLLIAAGGSILLIGLQSQINTYLNSNRVKNYRNVSPLEINSRSYKQVLVFSSFGQQLLLFSTQLEIEWIKREYLQWQSKIQNSYCNIQDELKKFLILLQNKNNPSSDQIKYRADSARSIFAEFVSKSGGSHDPNKNNKGKKKEEEKEIKKPKPGKTPQETESSIIRKYYEFQARHGYNGGNVFHP